MISKSEMRLGIITVRLAFQDNQSLLRSLIIIIIIIKKKQQHITSLFKITIRENLPKDMNLVSETFERISDSILILVCLLLLLFRCVGLL